MLSFGSRCRHKPHTDQSHAHPQEHFYPDAEQMHSPPGSTRRSPRSQDCVEAALQLFTSVALIAGRLSIPEVARC